MKKLLMIMLVSMVIILSLNFVSASSGAIWTTTSDCDSPQDENHYMWGEDVYVHGFSIAPGTYSWNIFAVPEKDPAIASGPVTVNSNAEFCFYAYTIQPGDAGVYKAYLGDIKSDNYNINKKNQVPEFGLITGIFTLMASIGIFFFVRK